MTSPPEHDEPEVLEELIAFVRRLSGRGLHREATELLLLAARFAPERPEYEELRRRASDVLASRFDTEPETAERGDRRELRREVIDACHFFGLARLYVERGEHAAALECLQMAKQKAATLPAPYKLHGRMLLQKKDYDAAAHELGMARRFNPFDREVHELLGFVEYERKQFAEALAATVDAFLLLGNEDSGASGRLRRRIRTLKRVLGWDNRQLIRLFHGRQEALSTAFERLQWHRDLFLEERGLVEQSLFGARSAPGGTRIFLAGSLRRLELWSHLADEAIFQLTEVVNEQHHEAGALIFDTDQESPDLYFVEQGEVEIRRPTTYGTFAVRTHARGALFGEGNFVGPRKRGAQAVARGAVRLLAIDGRALASLIEESPDVGAQIYASIWQALAHKLRATNELLRTFFPDDSPEAIPDSLRPAAATELATGSTALDAVVDSGDKIRLFREQGLSRKELLTLATFSREQRLAAGAYLFREGDAGADMYAVLDGQVRISKFIPGGGEEALAILERGDFFGEMALIEGQPRSADARAHRGTATLLCLDQSTIKEVLALDPQASLEFLQLLCRLLATRLSQMDEKIVIWQILASHQHSVPGESRGA